MTWTLISDLMTGGEYKIPNIDYIMINLPRDDAVKLFEARYNFNINQCSCECCNEDFFVETLTDNEALDRINNPDHQDYLNPEWSIIIRSDKQFERKD